MKAFVFDSALCNGCRNCQIVCKDEHVDNDWSPYAKPQPDTGQFWIKIEEEVRGSVPKVMMSYVVHLCQHCSEAPCATVCGPEAFTRREDGLLLIDYDRCNGCKACVEACPYKAIFFNESINAAQKCTGCSHLLDDGWSTPRCVDACPHAALRFDEIEVFDEELTRAEPLLEGAPGNPQVFYLNLPKRFLAGAVVDLEADEVIIGATVTLENLASSEVLVTSTNDFGDFWFKQIEAAPYRVYFEAEGYATRVIEVSTIGKDRNIGEIDLFLT